MKEHVVVRSDGEWEGSITVKNGEKQESVISTESKGFRSNIYHISKRKKNTPLFLEVECWKLPKDGKLKLRLEMR